MNSLFSFDAIKMMDGPDVLGQVVPGVVKEVGGKVGQAIFWGKVLMIAKYVGIAIFVLIVLWIVYKIIVALKK